MTNEQNLDVMTEKLFRAIYRSKSLMNKEGESELLVQSQISNALHGLTGVLFHHRGRFLQIVEGDEKLVLHLLEKIMKDPRHKQFQLLIAMKVEERLFPDWSMNSAALNREQFQAAVRKFSNGGGKVEEIVKGWLEQ